MWCDELYLVLSLQVVLVQILVFSCFNYSKVFAISFTYERKQVSIFSPFLLQVMRSVIFFNSINSISDLFQKIKSSSPCKQPHPCKIAPWILPFVNRPGIPTGQSKPRGGNKSYQTGSAELITSLFKINSHLEFFLRYRVQQQHSSLRIHRSFPLTRERVEGGKNWGWQALAILPNVLQNEQPLYRVCPG